MLTRVQILVTILLARDVTQQINQTRQTDVWLFTYLPKKIVSEPEKPVREALYRRKLDTVQVV